MPVVPFEGFVAGFPGKLMASLDDLPGCLCLHSLPVFILFPRDKILDFLSVGDKALKRQLRLSIGRQDRRENGKGRREIQIGRE